MLHTGPLTLAIMVNITHYKRQIRGMYFMCVCVFVCFTATDVVAPVWGSPGRRTRPGRGPHWSFWPRTGLTPQPPTEPGDPDRQRDSRTSASFSSAKFSSVGIQHFLQGVGRKKRASSLLHIPGLFLTLDNIGLLVVYWRKWPRCVFVTLKRALMLLWSCFVFSSRVALKL